MKPRTLQFDVIDASLLAKLAAKNAEPIRAVPTPFPTWNRACRDAGGGEGLAKGWHICVAGATGAGKSLVALNLAVAALRAGEHVCYISLEMSQDQLVTRLMAIATGYSVAHLEPGRGFKPVIEQTVRSDFLGLLERSGGSIRVNRYQLRDLMDISLVFSYYTTREPCGMFITDYMQLAWLTGAKSMLESITEISHTIRGFARDHEVISIGLSQFNRQTSANRTEAPRVEGLMGGSPLECDADQVILLDHSSHERHGASKATGKILLAKNRHGPNMEFGVQWDFETLRVQEATTAREGL